MKVFLNYLKREDFYKLNRSGVSFLSYAMSNSNEMALLKILEELPHTLEEQEEPHKPEMSPRLTPGIFGGYTQTKSQSRRGRRKSSKRRDTVLPSYSKRRKIICYYVKACYIIRTFLLYVPTYA